MKKYFFSFSMLFLISFALKAQTRNAAVKALNRYIDYSNANIAALKPVEQTLESYNGLFNDFLRHNTKLGGEPYEKPKPSPFLDEDVFTLNEDNPDYLYSLALKESTALPAALKTELNNSTKGMYACSQKLVRIMDSMSNIFSGPMITVTKNETVLPFSLLAEGRKQLQQSKKYRDQLFASIQSYYTKNLTLPAAGSEYMRSVAPLTRGMALCQNMMNDLSKNDSTKIPQYVYSLDSLCNYLDQSELELLKGIKPFGNSRNFPNKGYYNGFDLYTIYEDLLEQFRVFEKYGKKFMDKSDRTKYPSGKCHAFHAESSASFNALLGPLYNYNQFVLLIGGGKMTVIVEDVSKTFKTMKGWGDEKNALPEKTLLLWMKETPRFEIVWPKQ